MPTSPEEKSLGFQNEEKSYGIPQGNNYLLVIGIDQYSNGIKPLNNAVRDAKAFRDVLWGSYQFEKAHTLELYNEEASRSAIIRTFNDLMGRLSAEDNLVFYFSGHGEVHDRTGVGYWITADAVNEDTSTYVSNQEVTTFLRNLDARHIFGVVDSCFSAALFAHRDLDNATKRQYALPSRWLLTSGRLERVSDGRPGQHSPFAESLLHQLRYWEEPVLLGSDLCRAALRGVAFNADKQLPRGEPLQNTGHQGGEFVFFRKETKVSDYLKAKKFGQSSNLAAAYGMSGSSDLRLLKKQIQQLTFDPQKAGLYYRLNCDRLDKINKFWNCFDYRFPAEGFNFYFISSCPTQMPQCFSERAVVEVMVKELEEEQAGLHQRLQPNTNRIQLFDLPIGPNLKRSQRAFQKFFSNYFKSQGAFQKLLGKYFESNKQEDLETLFRKALVGKGYKYAAIVFTIYETQWGSVHPDYFRWMIEELSQVKLPGVRVLLFFSVKVDALHRKENLTDDQRLIKQTFKQLEEEYKQRVVHLSPLQPVVDKDLKDWFARLGEGNPGKVEKLLAAFVQSLSAEDRKLYEQHQLFNMDDIDALQEVVFEVMNE